MDIQAQRATEISRRLGKRKGAPIRKSFAQTTSGSTPLSEIMSGRSARSGGGGRGGKTRVAVLLSLIWVLAAPPHTSNRPARFWAELIGLEDPEHAGARAVSASLLELEKRGFLKLEHQQPGYPPLISLLNENLDGNYYTIPGNLKEGPREPYFRVPNLLWRSGGIKDLSGPALVMYLVVLSVYRTDIEDYRAWFSSSSFKEKFGLGESTRKNGLRELVAQGILHPYDESLDFAGETGSRRFKRRTYELDPKYQ